MEINIPKLSQIAKLDVRQVCRNEEEVKMKIIRPILEALGYNEPDYESDRSDILVPGILLLEAKNQSIKLDKFITQLEGYWNHKRTRFAVLCNGIEFWVYHPAWPGKRFEETLIKKLIIKELLSEVNFLNDFLSFEAVISGRSKQKLREVEDLEEIELQKFNMNKKRKKEIESELLALESEKIEEVKKINLRYSQQADKLTEELKQIDRYLDTTIHIPRMSDSIRTNKSIETGSFSKTDQEFLKVEVLDKANYFGLVEGKQIMFCTARKKGSLILLWCKEEKTSTKYGLSQEGQRITEKRIFDNTSSYIGEVIYLPVTKNNLNLWNELYREKLFPYWDPQTGPYEYNKQNIKQIAICRVYKTQITLEKKDIGSGRTSRLLKNHEKITLLKSKLDSMTPILPSEDFNQKKYRIEELMNKYQ